MMQGEKSEDQIAEYRLNLRIKNCQILNFFQKIA